MAKKPTRKKGAEKKKPRPASKAKPPMRAAAKAKAPKAKTAKSVASAKKTAGRKAPEKKAATLKAAPTSKSAKRKSGGESALRDSVMKALDKMKAESLVCVDVRGESSLTDFFIIASGRSNRQVRSLAEEARKAFFAHGIKNVRIEGATQGDWVVVDGGDVIVHLFRPEVRQFYRLEEVWGLEPPLQDTIRNL